ncbi:MAG: hypothetical protein ACOC3E_00140 [Cyanobacteriota bacterium]
MLNNDVRTLNQQVTDTVEHLPASGQPDQLGIKELLVPLQRVINAENSLSVEDKTEALKQVQALAEAGKAPENEAKRSQAHTAIRVLRGMIAELPEATDFNQVATRLLPQLDVIFGLG